MGIEELLLNRAEKKGEIKGELKGREKGRKEGAFAIAIEMKKEGISIEQIEKFTKLSVEEIEKL